MHTKNFFTLGVSALLLATAVTGHTAPVSKPTPCTQNCAAQRADSQNPNAPSQPEPANATSETRALHRLEAPGAVNRKLTRLTSLGNMR